MKTRAGRGAFEIRYQNGKAQVVKADAIIDASGPGICRTRQAPTACRAIGETEVADRIAYGCPTRSGKDRGAMPARPSPRWVPVTPRSAR